MPPVRAQARRLCHMGKEVLARFKDLVDRR